MAKNIQKNMERVAVCVVAALIPLMLIFGAMIAGKYESLEAEVRMLEAKQEELVESNKKLVSDISILSSADEIERRAVAELGMRKAEKDDIVRVEIGNGM